MAFASVVAAKECGLSVPEDLSVIGFDNISLSEMSIPKITTVNHPCFEIGFLSGEMIHKQCVDRSDIPKSTLLNTELILRGSTPVSYTHLDVYKRQVHSSPLSARKRATI